MLAPIITGLHYHKVVRPSAHCRRSVLVPLHLYLLSITRHSLLPAHCLLLTTYYLLLTTYRGDQLRGSRPQRAVLASHGRAVPHAHAFEVSGGLVGAVVLAERLVRVRVGVGVGLALGLFFPSI